MAVNRCGWIAVFVAGACVVCLVDFASGQDLEGSSLFRMNSIERTMDELHSQKREPTEYEKLNQQALSRMVEKDWNEVFKLLKQALTLDAKQVDAYINFSRAHYMRQEYASAEKALLKALEMNPESAPAWFEYAKLMVIKEDLDAAVRGATNAVVLSEGRDWRYLQLQAEVTAAQGDEPGALLALDQAIKAIESSISIIEKAINREEQRVEVTNLIEEEELVNDISGRTIQVPVTRFETENKIAPKAWHDARDSLKDKLARMETRRAELVAGTSSTNR